MLTLHSTCICAGFRVHAMDFYYHSVDRTYTAPAMYLWSLAEITCLFFVFCVPTVPRALARIKERKRMGVNPSSRSRNTVRDICSSRSSVQLRLNDRPSSTYVHDQRELNNIRNSPFLRETSAPSNRGPITEITGGKQEDHDPEQEVPFGIMRTTQLTTQISVREEVEGEEDAAKEYNRYQWPSSHMH
jgi:hypothetical protein